MLRTVLLKSLKITSIMLAMAAGSASAGPRCYVGLQTSLSLADPASLHMVIGCGQDKRNAAGMPKGLDAQVLLGPSSVQVRAGVLAGGKCSTTMGLIGGGYNFANGQFLLSAGAQRDGIRVTLDREIEGSPSLSIQANSQLRETK